MDGEVISNAGADGLLGVKSSITEIICDTCGRSVARGAAANSTLCPACGGHMVGIRIFRNALTGKILLAERVDF